MSAIRNAIMGHMWLQSAQRYMKVESRSQWKRNTPGSSLQYCKRAQKTTPTIGHSIFNCVVWCSPKTCILSQKCLLL